MEVGLGVLGMRPPDFWSLTVPEFNAKLRGWREANCAGAKGPSDHEAEDIDRETDELMKHFPDGPLPKGMRRRHAANKAAARGRWRTT